MSEMPVTDRKIQLQSLAAFPIQYNTLIDVFLEAVERASAGKGLQHVQEKGQDFDKQPICTITTRHGHGFTRGQAEKKLDEISRMNGKAAQYLEILDVLNYLAADLIVLWTEMTPDEITEVRECLSVQE